MTDTGTQYEHQPVMLEEVLEMWFSRSDGAYVDGTFGRGGHSRALGRLDPKGRLVGIDRDPQAIAVGDALAAEDSRFQIVANRFDCLPQAVAALGRPIDGLLLDLGVSSPQLDDAAQGSVSCAMVLWICAWIPPVVKVSRVAGAGRRKGDCRCVVSLR